MQGPDAKPGLKGAYRTQYTDLGVAKGSLQVREVRFNRMGSSLGKCLSLMEPP